MRIFLRSVSLFFLLLSSLAAQSQTMDWGWSRSYGSNSTNRDVHITTNSQNGIFTCGQFGSSGTQVGSYTFTSAGGQDIILTKHDTSGNLLWAKAFGGSGTDKASSISADKNGDIFIGGYFTGSISFDAVSLTSAGGTDGFIAKLNPAGSVLWAKKIGGNQDDDVAVVKCFKDDIYIAGSYLSTDFAINSISLTKTLPFQLFYARLDQSGVAVWAQKGGYSTGGSFFNDIEIQDNYKVELFGWVSDEVNFNPSPSVPLTVPFPCMFHLKVSSAGIFEYQLLSGLGTRSANPGGVAFAPAKSAVYSGIGRTLSSDAKGFLIKRDSSNNIIPSAPLNKLGPVAGQDITTSNSATYDVVLDKDTEFIAVGGFYGGCSFGSGITTPVLPDISYNAAFIWRTDSNLLTKVVLTSGIKKDFSSVFSSVTIDTTTNIIYAAGNFSKSGTSNTYVIGNESLQNQGVYNILISKIYPDAPAPAPLVADAGRDTVICAGSAATIGIGATGGIPGYYYSWSPATDVQHPNAATTTVKPLSNTIYTLSVTDASLNTASSTVSVQIAAGSSAPVITASGPLIICEGGSVTLTSSTADSYLWSNGAVTQSVTVSTAGNYSVTTTTAASGCGPQTSAVVTVGTAVSPIRPSITVDGSLTFCQGGNVTLISTLGTTYLWSNGATTRTITVNTSGNYSVIVTNAAGCSSVASLPVTVTVLATPAKPVISAAGSLQFCEGGSVQLSSTPANTYIWNNGSSTQSINVFASGNYTVIVSNAQGCSSPASDPIAVIVWPKPALPTVSASSPVQFCEGGSVSLMSTTGNAYAWSNGATTQSINVTTTGNYSVIINTSDGCSSVASAPVTVTVHNNPAQPVITASGSLSFCQGDNVILTSSTANAYSWSNGATTQSITVNNAGNFSVIVSNAQGCNSIASAITSTTVNALPPVPTISRSDNQLISSAATGNQWYFDGNAIPGATSNTLTISGFGNYSVEVTNAEGCSRSSAPFTVESLLGEITILNNGDRFIHLTRPNPANTQAILNFQLANPAKVSVALVSDKGNLAAMPLTTRQMAAGSHEIKLDNFIRLLPAGVYYIVYRVNNERITDKLVIVK